MSVKGLKAVRSVDTCIVSRPLNAIGENELSQLPMSSPDPPMLDPESTEHTPLALGSVKTDDDSARDCAHESLGTNRQRKSTSQDDWSQAYRSACTLVALLIGCSPLLMVSVLAVNLSLTPAQDHQSQCNASELRTLTTLERGAERVVALVTLIDEGPRGEYHRLSRFAVANKRNYAARHNYSLYGIAAPPPTCLGNTFALFKLRALQSLLRKPPADW